MKMMLSTSTAAVIALGTVTLAVTLVPQRKGEIVGVTAEQVRWFTPAYYKDGRQRAQLFGDSNQGGPYLSAS